MKRKYKNVTHVCIADVYLGDSLVSTHMFEKDLRQSQDNFLKKCLEYLSAQTGISDFTNYSIKLTLKTL